MRIAEPSNSVKEPVPITCPDVGDQFAQTQGAESIREHFRIARRTFVLQQYHRTEKGLAWPVHVQRITAARMLVLFAG